MIGVGFTPTAVGESDFSIQLLNLDDPCNQVVVYVHTDSSETPQQYLNVTPSLNFGACCLGKVAKASIFVKNRHELDLDVSLQVGRVPPC